MELDSINIDHQRVPTNGTHLEIILAGPTNGTPVILLHGFPEFWYSYRFQIPALARAGFRVVAPDQRGYNRSDKHGPFDLRTLCADIAGLQDVLGLHSSHLIGHDWGGAVAWAFTGLYPQRVQKLVILNAPHMGAYQDTCKRHPVQLLKSAYILYFQLPWLPEWSLRRKGFTILQQTFSSINPRFMCAEDIEEYKKACAQPGALSAMLGWYRAALRSQETRQLLQGSSLYVHRPTLVIWGKKDPYLDPRCNETLPFYVDDVQIHYLENANHWVQMDQPEIVNDLLLNYLLPI